MIASPTVAMALSAGVGAPRALAYSNIDTVVVLASPDRYWVTTKSSIEMANATAALATIAGNSSGSSTRNTWSRGGAPRSAAASSNSGPIETSRPRWLALVTALYVLWSVVPVLLAIAFAFNAGRSRTTWQGFSLRWFTGSTGSVMHDPALRDALGHTLLLAVVCVAIATPLGVALALGLQRWRGRGSGTVNSLMLLPLVTPEIVMGVALLLLFLRIFPGIGLGTEAQVIGQVTFTLSYVVVIVRGRLVSIGPEFEEAAADLGAPRALA